MITNKPSGIPAFNAAVNDNKDGQFGEADVPDNCPECGDAWSGCERLHTGDDKGIGGWEQWMYCQFCGCEMFFPVTHRPTSDAAISKVEGRKE